MRKSKYLHVFWYPGTAFNMDLMAMINGEKDYFDPTEHRFVTPWKIVYDGLKAYGDIEFASFAKIITVYFYQSDWIILHSISGAHHCLRCLLWIPGQTCRRIVLRTWGHDMTKYAHLPHRPIKNFVRKWMDRLYYYKLDRFYAFGLGSYVDKVNIEKMLGTNKKTYLMPYGYIRNDPEDIARKMPKKAVKAAGAAPCIMIGHCASEFEDHIQMFHILEKFKEENIKIIVPFVYPTENTEYREKVKAAGIGIFGDKIEFAETSMEKALWSEYISQAEIMLLAPPQSTALGTLDLMLFFKAKVYVNRESVFAKAFEQKGITPHYISDIADESFEQFIQNKFDERYDAFVKGDLRTPGTALNEWKEIFEDLDAETARRKRA